MSRRYILWLVVLGYFAVALTLAAARISGLDQWGDLFSLGQLLVDALLLPIAVITFVMAADEFRKTQRSPELDLYWEVEPGRIEKKIVLSLPLPTATLSEPVVHSKGIRPVLVNSGQAVAVWYMLTFDVPKEIVSPRPLGSRGTWERHQGGQSNWLQEDLPDVWRVVFQSNGEVACYPGYPLRLGILGLGIATDSQSKAYAVPYTILTDQGLITEGSLLVRLKWVSHE